MSFDGSFQINSECVNVASYAGLIYSLQSAWKVFENETGQIARTIEGPFGRCEHPRVRCRIWDVIEDDDSDPLGDDDEKFWVFGALYSPEGYVWTKANSILPLPEVIIRVDGPRHEHDAAKVVLLRFRELFPQRRFFSLNRLLQDESEIPDLIITAPDSP